MSKKTHKKKSTCWGPTNSAGKRMTDNQKRANIGKKVLKIPNQKSTHTVPTNSMGKSLSNRNEFNLLAVGKG